MKAVIMAGGEGTRLRPLTCEKPKPMVTLFDKPVMEHIIALLKAHHLTKIGVTLQYMPDEIIDYFGDGRQFGVELSYFVEKTPLGTAGSVRGAADFLNEDFVVISGDCVCDMDLTEGIRFHEEAGALATLILKKVEEPLQYGVVLCGPDGKVERFIEKPSWPQVFCDTVNTGIYIFKKEVLSYIPENAFHDFSKDLFPRLLKEGLALYGRSLEGYWCDIGDCSAYLRCHMDLLEKQGENLYAGPGAVVEQGALTGGRCALEEGARIARGATVENSLIKKGAKVLSGAYVSGAVIGEGAVVSENAVCLEGSVLGKGASAAPSALVGSGVKVWPKAEAQGRVTKNILSSQGGLYPCYGAFCAREEDCGELFYSLGRAVCSFFPGKICVGGLSDTGLFRRSFIGGCEGPEVYSAGTVSRGAFVSFLMEKGCAGGVYFTLDGRDREAKALIYDKRGLPIGEGAVKKIAGLLSLGQKPKGDQSPIYSCEGIESIYIRRVAKELGLTRYSGEKIGFFGDGGHNAAQAARLLKESGIIASTSPAAQNLPALYIEGEDLYVRDRAGKTIGGAGLFLVLCLLYRKAFPQHTLYIRASDPSCTEQVAGGGNILRFDSNYTGVTEDTHSIHAQEDVLFRAGLSLTGLFENESLTGLIPDVFVSSREVYCPPSRKGGVIFDLLKDKGVDKNNTEGVRIRVKERGSIYIVAHPHRHVCTVTADAFQEEISQELCDFYAGRIEKFVGVEEQPSQNPGI